MERRRRGSRSPGTARPVAALACVLWAGGSLAAPPEPAATPAMKAPVLTVTLTQTRPLRLVEWVWKKGKPGEVALDGALLVKVTNTTSDPIDIRRLEVHGLRFLEPRRPEDRTAKPRSHVVIHPCQCVRDHTEPVPPIRLAPGASEEIALDEWGCSGYWQPPPPGTYQVSYRVLAALPPPPARTPAAEPDFHTVRDTCARALHGEEFWAGAVVSNPLAITLKKPRRKRLPR